MDSVKSLRYVGTMSVLAVVLMCHNEVTSLDPAAGVSTPRTSACSGLPMTGLCRASIPKWYYNSTSSECQRFIYGGCGGNENRHDSREDCQRTCVKSRQAGPKQNGGQGGQGGGKNKKPRPSNKPKPGGRGDPSKTMSIVSTGGRVAAIVGTDVTLLCRGNVTWVFYSPSSFQEVVLARGNEIGANYSERMAVQVSDNQSSLKIGKVHQSDRGRYECLDPMSEADGVLFELNVYPSASDEACRGSPMTGSCSTRTSRWFYNATASRCQRFFYGGCEGSDNRYDSRPQCERTCLGRPVQEQQQPQSGPTGTGGGRKEGNGGGRRPVAPPRTPRAAGDDVVVATAAESDDSTNKTDVCRGFADPGVCRGAFPRWNYNEERATCEPFIYGGCPGSNHNVHETEADCRRACVRDN